jgi:hypothetical protein
VHRLLHDRCYLGRMNHLRFARVDSSRDGGAQFLPAGELCGEPDEAAQSSRAFLHTGIGQVRVGLLGTPAEVFWGGCPASQGAPAVLVELSPALARSTLRHRLPDSPFGHGLIVAACVGAGRPGGVAADGVPVGGLPTRSP